MNKAFSIATDLVAATIAYHEAVRGGDEAKIKKAYRVLCDTQNHLSAVCEDIANGAE